MNRLQSPCVKDTNYNFALCVEKSIVKKAGCLPFWNEFIFNDHDKVEMPFCENISMLNQYGVIYTQFIEMPRDELIGTTQCLMPCSYLEYTFVCI